MQILLLKSESRLNSWADRLSKFDSDVKVVLGDREIDLDQYKHQSFALAVCQWSLISSWDEAALAALRSRCERVCCVVGDDEREVVPVAYQAGVDDCISEDCSDAELNAKVEQGIHAWQLRQRLDQALKLESIGELAAGIAHEINTPIQYVGDNTRFVQTACDDLLSVIGACQKVISAVDNAQEVGQAASGLQDSLESADAEYLMDEVPSAIAQTLEGVDRVAAIVRAMKEFAHPGASEMTLTDLSKAIEATVTIARNEWKYVAEMETAYDESLPSVPCLPGEMNQVILNLIVNASHAIKDALQDDSQQKGKITITTKMEDSFAEIRVSDTGTGISPENIEKIFNPFFTTKSAGKGTGQGLALAHSVIVDKHSGTISVESELGFGSTFVIRIPLTQDEGAVDDDSLAAATS